VNKLRRGEVGYLGLAHPRLGLLGWVSYWSRGSKDIPVKMIVSLCKKLNLAEQVSNNLPKTVAMKETETNASGGYTVWMSISLVLHSRSGTD